MSDVEEDKEGKVKYTGALLSLSYYLRSFHDRRGKDFADMFLHRHDYDVKRVCGLLTTAASQKDLMEMGAEAISMKKLIATRERLRIIMFHLDNEAWLKQWIESLDDKGYAMKEFMKLISAQEVDVVLAGNPFILVELLLTIDKFPILMVLAACDALFTSIFGDDDEADEDSDEVDGDDDDDEKKEKKEKKMKKIVNVNKPSAVVHRMLRRRGILVYESIRRLRDARANRFDYLTTDEIFDVLDQNGNGVEDFEFDDGNITRLDLVRNLLNFDVSMGHWKSHRMYKVLCLDYVVDGADPAQTFWNMSSFEIQEHWYAAYGESLHFIIRRAFERLTPGLSLVSLDKAPSNDDDNDDDEDSGPQVVLRIQSRVIAERGVVDLIINT